jgi:2'-5' RNA ligase
MSTSSRLFIAIPVCLYDYHQIQHDFGPFLKGKWRNEATLHVTIAFLGTRFNAEKTIEALDTFDWSFELTELTGWDYFTQSRVFVATTQNPTLQNLYDRLAPLLNLESALLAPHVTLIRVKRFNDAEEFSRRLKTPPPHPLGWLEPKVILYESTLLPQGAHYRPLQEWRLQLRYNPT